MSILCFKHENICVFNEFQPFPSQLAAYLSSLLEDCILVSGALVDQGELLCKVLPPWPLLFQQKECYASCIWTSSGIQCAGSLIAHFQLLLSNTDFPFAPRNQVFLLSCENWFVGHGSRPRWANKYPPIDRTTKRTRRTHTQFPRTKTNTSGSTQIAFSRSPCSAHSIACSSYSSWSCPV